MRSAGRVYLLSNEGRFGCSWPCWPYSSCSSRCLLDEDSAATNLDVGSCNLLQMHIRMTSLEQPSRTSSICRAGHLLSKPAHLLLRSCRVILLGDVHECAAVALVHCQAEAGYLASSAQALELNDLHVLIHIQSTESLPSCQEATAYFSGVICRRKQRFESEYRVMSI